ncbi:MAG: hypothetical protein AAB777_01670, partial [Patescibacteria group bacterium]
PRSLRSSGDSSHPSGGANNTLNEMSVPGSNATNKGIVARLALLLNRLLHGEEAHLELFDCVFECVKFLNVNNITEEQIHTLESLTVARILHKLGYIGEDAKLDGHLKSNNITAQMLDELESKRIIINKHINKALKESHL